MKWYFILPLLLYALKTNAQALDQFGVKKGVTINGSLNASTTLYGASGIESRRDPLAWYLNGNLNINLFGYSMPFTFSYSNQGTSYSQPFNQFRFAPSYKWARAYFGTTSMNFSNYTLAGHMFDGVGVELSPGKWRVSAMYGTLLKPVQFDVLHPENYSRAAFERKGYGLKTGYENDGNSYSISVFKARDNINSLHFIPDDASITPQENIAVAFNIRQRFLQHFFTDIEYSVSALDRDTRSGKLDSTEHSPSNLLGKFLTTDGSVRYFDAIQAGLGYTGTSYSIQVRYERVAPDYVTLGAYNVVNDMRNITLAPAVQLFNGKVNLSANAGWQVNNLDHTKSSDMKRWVASVNAGIVPNTHWAFSGGYSNFTNFTRNRPLIDPYFNNNLDTLDFYQVNNTYNGMVMFRTGTKERQHMISLNSSYQYASDRSTESTPDLSRFFTSALSYTYNIEPKAVSVSGGINYYQNNVTTLNTSFIGPSVNFTKQYFEKTFRTGITATYNVTKSESLGNTTIGSLFNTGLNLNYAPKPRQREEKNKSAHNIGANITYLIRSAGGSQPGYNEITSTVNYTYSF